ncbi:hypothetical protein GCM10009434_11470 [Brevundimonas olei]
MKPQVNGRLQVPETSDARNKPSGGEGVGRRNGYLGSGFGLQDVFEGGLKSVKAPSQDRMELGSDRREADLARAALEERLTGMRL